MSVLPLLERDTFEEKLERSVEEHVRSFRGALCPFLGEDVADVRYRIQVIHDRLPDCGEIQVIWTIRKLCTFGYDNFKAATEAPIETEPIIDLSVLGQFAPLFCFCGKKG